jgi:hypothetical protein
MGCAPARAALKAERGAGSAAAVSRSGAALVLAEEIAPPYRALILLAVFGSLRWGELAGLQRNDIDLEAGTIRIERQLAEQRGGGFTVAPPKSEAGTRTVVIPQAITPIISHHMHTYVTAGPDSLVFTSAAGQPLRHANFRARIWLPALRAADLSMIHFHDLRHTGNMLASSSAGAGLRELMDRMGHSTSRAALLYLHHDDERQQAIAEALSKLAIAEMKRGNARVIGHAAGTQTPESFVKMTRAGGSDRLTWGLAGAPGRDRTCDQLLRRQSLYPLSYRRSLHIVPDPGYAPITISGPTARWPAV